MSFETSIEGTVGQPSKENVSTKPKLYEDIDWPGLLKTLWVCAQRLRAAAAVFDCGVSPDDLVNETLEAFWSSENALGWTAKKGSIEAFLCTVLKRRFIDHIRRDEKVAGSFDDQKLEYPSSLQSQESPTHDDLSYKEFADKMRSMVHGRKDLEDLITASEMTDGGHNVNEQLAEILETTTKDVVNRKKQLLRVPGMKKLYDERSKEKNA